MSHAASDEIMPLNIAVLTVSDTRTIENDTSGSYLVKALEEAGHKLADRQISKDDKYALRAIVSRWIADGNIHVIVSTGGTGFTQRDTTPEALLPLLDKKIDGFGEVHHFQNPVACQLYSALIVLNYSFNF